MTTTSLSVCKFVIKHSICLPRRGFACPVGSLSCCQGLCRSFWRAGAECEELEGEALYKLVNVFSAGEAFSWLNHLVHMLPSNVIMNRSNNQRGCLLQASEQPHVRIESVLLKLCSLAVSWCGATLALPAAVAS